MASASLEGSTKRLEGKVAIITGGASGIGAAAASLFHANGALVVVADVQDDLGKAVVAKLGGGAEYVHCDVSKEEDVSNLVDATVAKHGKMDIMYNNAGIIDKLACPIVDTSLSDLDRVMRVNLYGSFLGAKHAARVMVPQREGCILFTGSACTVTCGISTHTYAASKYGMLGLAKNLASELAQFGIRVNCVAPYAVLGTGIANGLIDLKHVDLTAINLRGPVLTPGEVAQAALYLASDEAKHVNGVNLVLDGGFRFMKNASK